MTNKKISALTAATTPLAGTEVLPIVQSSTTTQVSVANLTAGRSVSVANLTVSTGNITPSTAAKGINFTANTPAAGMTSQLLNWYEEGTWTPTFTTWAVAPTLDHATYTRIGRQVTLNMVMQGGTCVAGSSIGGLPFTSGSAGGAAVLATNSTTNNIAFSGTIFNATSSIQYISAATISSTSYWALSSTYFA